MLFAICSGATIRCGEIKMALERAPVDEVTKLPLLCVPHPDSASVTQGLQPNGGLFDWDHPFRPRLDPLLTGTLGGRAVRQAWLQLLHRTAQHEPKDHGLAGPLLPETQEDQFRTVLWCAAMYIPRQALDFSTGSMREVAISQSQHRRLQTSGEVKVGSPELARDFFLEFAMQQEVEISPSLINEFLGLVPNSAASQRRKQHLARQLLHLMMEPPTARLARVYRSGFDQGLLGPDVPPSPLDLVGRRMEAYTWRSWRRRIIEPLEARLRARREGRPAPTPNMMPKVRPVGRIALAPWGSQLSTGNALA